MTPVSNRSFFDDPRCVGYARFVIITSGKSLMMEIYIFRPAVMRQPSLQRGLGTCTSHVVFAAIAVTLAFSSPPTVAEAKERGGAAFAREYQGTTVGGANTIIDLQPMRRTNSSRIKGLHGEAGNATLINLNPNVNAWYLLELALPDRTPARMFHLELTNPESQTLLLDSSYPYGLVVVEGKDRRSCELWGTGESETLRKARESGVPYAPLCGGKVYLRNPTEGHRTEIEAVTDFLRDKMPEGEKIVDFVRDSVFRFVYQEKAEEPVESKTRAQGLPGAKEVGAPVPALLNPAHANRKVKTEDLGIEIESPDTDGMVLGAWYAAKNIPGVFVSIVMPDVISSAILESDRDIVSALDGVEGREIVYLVAFDLSLFDLKYSLGTEHPRVDWSEHILDQMRDGSLPGPDGIGTTEPLISTGLIMPADASTAVAAFTGGFKRAHGAFKYGALALKNHGSHYGFVEDGVIFSRLQPGLATIYVAGDRPADMKTWTENDNNLLPKIKYARQNGVPIVDGLDPRTQSSVPGPLVSRWGEGNWSGSVDMKLQTVRAGAALQPAGEKRFLLYAFFWSATPSSMARVFQAYRCSYAMLLDMNAPVHTYLALYRRQGSSLYVQHLVREMSQVDISVKGQYVPRFLGYADDRDFFYLVKKGRP
jgi:hypothetical protein